MADVFISYARADRGAIESLAQTLEDSGISVWWDRQLLGGDHFSDEIERELARARIVLVCWSQHGSRSRWVRDEASVAADAGKLVSLSLDGSAPPIGFRQFHWIDFSGSRDEGLQSVLRAVRSRLDRPAPTGGAGATPVPRSASRRRLALGAVAVVAVVVVAAAWFLGPREPQQRAGEETSTPRTAGQAETPVLDERRVVVMPFRVTTPDALAYLGQGFMDLLSAGLNGEVGPQAVEPGAVAALATQAGQTATSVARQLGAGLALTGSIVGSEERVVISAEIRRIADGGLVADAAVEGPAAQFPALADQLIIKLLSLAAGEYPTSIASLTSTSAEALKEYLLGKAAFRDGTYLRGISHLENALAIDPTFALAAIARADGATNAVTVSAEDYLERAWAHRDRLSERDRQYLETRLPQQPRTYAEQLAAYARLVDRQPDRVEAWYWYFEHVWHQQGNVDDDHWFEQVRVMGERILALDPGFYPVIDHFIFAACEVWPQDAQAIYQKFYARDASEFLRWDMFRSLAEGGDRLSLDPATLAGIDGGGVLMAPWLPAYQPDCAPDGFMRWVDASHAEARRRVGTDFPLATALRVEYHSNVAYGRLARAAAVRAEAMAEKAWRLPRREALDSAAWYGVDLAAAETVAAELAAGLPADDGSLALAQAEDLVTLETWRYVQDPAYTSSTAVARLRAGIGAAPHPENLQREAHALLFQGWAEARRGNAEAARATLARLIDIVRQGPGGVVGEAPFLFATAQAWEEAGDTERALETVRRVNIGRSYHTFAARRLYEIARLSALRGDVAGAVRHYRRYLTLHGEADPVLQLQVEAARAALARLEAA